ncbi:MAG: SMP-30/gluconolactonase/LRE family protein [Methylobacteriaceae bacterium]|nr:SMP-30/gluconolactonase/LRE family protein [Methylobacteriaceae bacterium]
MRVRPPGDLVGSLAVCDTGGLLVAVRGGLSFFDPASGTFEMVANPEADLPDYRFNDGKCDRAGRFWVGSMHNTLRGEFSGFLYRLDRERGCIRMADGIAIPNSLAWSRDDRTMYFADTYRRTIFAYDFDIESGGIGNRRVFAPATGRPGAPDGSTVDVDNFLWNAVYGGGRLDRYAPDGRLDCEIRLPMSQPTSCAFGGPSLETLYVTSATQHMREEDLARQPFAGAVIALNVGVRGLPEPYFARSAKG